LAATLIPVVFLLVLEGILRLAGYGYPTAFFLGRTVDGRPVWTENQEFGKRFFPPGLVRYTRPMVLPATKSAYALRVFVLGESAALGDPDPKFGMPRMLEALLRERFPGRQVEVVNAAMAAINSNVILPIAQECARREGDVWVVYMGNNEVIGPFGSASVFGAQAPPLGLVRATLWLKTSKVGQMLDGVMRAVRPGSRAPAEWGGMTMMAEQRVRPDEPSARRVRAHFEANLRAIIAAGRRARLPIILCTVATNLKDCPPFASLHQDGLSAAELAQWDAAYQEGVTLEAQGKLADATAAYQRAARSDQHFAALCYRWGRCCLLTGQLAQGRKLLGEARDWDALQFRTDSRLNSIIRRLAAEHSAAGVRLLDAEAVFAAHSPYGVAGAELFLEHVHLQPAGNYLLARALADQVAQTLSRKNNGALAAEERPWLTESECLERIGFTEWNRYHILEEILDRAKQPPFTGQIDHERQVEALQDQLQKCRLATKPAQLKQAIARVTRALNLEPHNADLHWNLAELCDAAGERSRSEQEWREVVRSHPLASRPRYHLARLLEREGKADEAARSYAEALRIAPEDFEAREALGILLASQGRMAEAIRQLRLAVRQKPQSVAARLALGSALAQGGDRREADQEFREVLRLEPGNPQAQKQLGPRTGTK
jgi:tetratricopeptide (TPR) repeat protein